MKYRKKAEIDTKKVPMVDPEINVAKKEVIA